MMIRINLLPVRQVQKREQGRQFIVLMVGMFIIAGCSQRLLVRLDWTESARRRSGASMTPTRASPSSRR